MASEQAPESELKNHIIKGLPDNLVVIGTDGEILYVNNGWREFARNNGLSPEYCSEGTNYLKVCDEATGENSEEAPIVARGIRDVIQGYKDSFELEYPCHAPDKKRWFVMKVISLGNERPGYVLIYHLDITERKQTEEELKKSEEKYRELINGMNDSVWVMDLEGNIVDVNTAAVNQLGYSKDELLSMKPQDIDVALDNETISELIKQIPNDTVQVFETAHVTKSGKIIPVEINSSLITYNGKPAILSIARDITKRKQLEDRMKKVNNTLVNLGVDHDENIKRLTDLCGELLGASAALYNHLENGMLVSKAQWHTPENYNSIDHPDGHICYDIIMNGSRKTWIIRDLPNTKYADTDPNLAKSGFKSYIGRVVHCNGNPVGTLCALYLEDVIFTDDDKHILSIIASSISSEEERKQANIELQEYARKLENLNETKEMFTDVLRHDLLNPVGLVKGFADLLYKKETDDKKLSIINKIIRNNERAIELIENASNLAKIESMKNIEFEQLDLGKIIDNVIENQQTKLIEKNMDIIFLKHDDQYYAYVNPIIEQAFLNLLNNSIKYSPEESKITVDILDNDDFWKVRVRDSGPGIPDEDKVCLFDRFRRGDNKKPTGKGLGLSIVRNIVDLHGGSVGVEDNPDGKGSMFWLTVKKANICGY